MEQKNELALLLNYFKKLEATAKHMGIELDDFITAYRDNDYAKFADEEIISKISERKNLFKNATDDKSPGKTNILNKH